MSRSRWSQINKTSLSLGKPLFGLPERLHICCPKLWFKVRAFRIVVCWCWRPFNNPKKIIFFLIQETSCALRAFSCNLRKTWSQVVSPRAKVLILSSADIGIHILSFFNWRSKELKLFLFGKSGILCLWRVQPWSPMIFNSFLFLHMGFEFQLVFVPMNIFKSLLQIHFSVCYFIFGLTR